MLHTGSITPDTLLLLICYIICTFSKHFYIHFKKTNEKKKTDGNSLCILMQCYFDGFQCSRILVPIAAALAMVWKIHSRAPVMRLNPRFQVTIARQAVRTSS